MNLITAISFDASSAHRAERLLDLIYWQSGRQTSGHCLLIAAHGTHAEWKTKLSIAAEPGFSSVEVVMAAPGENSLIKAITFTAQNYKHPWVYLEPDCVPLVSGWRQKLLDAYDAQPKRYFGPHLRTGDKIALSMVAVYPPNAAIDLGKDMLPLSSKSRAIQRMVYTGDDTKIRADAVVLDGDPTGELVEKMIEKSSTSIDINITNNKPKRGRPRKIGILV